MTNKQQELLDNLLTAMEAKITAKYEYEKACQGADAAYERYMAYLKESSTLPAAKVEDEIFYLDLEGKYKSL